MILLTIKRIKHKGHEEYITVSTYWLEFMFLAPFFFQYFVANHDSLLKFSKTESSVYTLDVLFPFSKILLLFKNWGMRRTTGTTGFLWSRFDVPSLSLPGVAKMTKSLKTLGTRLAPGPQHLKQEKRKEQKKKGGKWKLTACENRRKRECLIILLFTLSRTYLVFPTGNSWLWNPTFVYLKDWQGMRMNLQLSYRTLSI